MLQAVLILEKARAEALKMQQEMEQILSKVSRTFKFSMLRFYVLFRVLKRKSCALRLKNQIIES
jgi:hypothetical protein